METTTTTTCGDLLLLPEDVLINNILVCLPVKSLLRFKSVCKSWRQLIQTPFFIDLHTTTTTSSKFGYTYIIQTTDHGEDGIKLFMLSSESGNVDNNEEDDQKKKVFKVDDLGFSPFYKDYLLEHTLCMVGSCNGIICLHDAHVMDIDRGCIKQLYSHLRDICLWNPATRQFRILPKSIPVQEKGNWYEIIAFGFDVKTKDYKVLRFTTPWEQSKEEEGGCMCDVQVYSLSTDSWRLLERVDSQLLPVLPNQSTTLFNHHRIYLGNGRGFMVSFDFTKDIFTTMQIPGYNSSFTSYLGERFFLTTPSQDYDDGDYEYYDIYVLKEQHCGLVDKESWTKLHSFRLESSRHTVPRCISNNGVFNKLQVRTGECSTVYVYKESLVSIMGGRNVLLRWQLPTHGTTYKLNLDAPFIGPFRSFGIGLCLTSDTGGCIGVRSLKSYDVRDATQGEALAMLEAIKWVKKLELSPIIIESDSKNVVSFFMDDDDNNSTYWSSEALALLSEAKLLLNSSEISISLKYGSTSCNYVADIAAKLGREGLSWFCKDWTANFPGEMVMSLSKDLGLVRW